MKVASFALVFLVLCALVFVNAGSGRRALATGTSIVVVVGGLLLMAALFAWLITRPAL